MDHHTMDTGSAWQTFFESWPAAQPQVGIVVTTFQDNIPFSRFLVADGLLALERDKPDSIGSRKVIIAFTAISAVKMTDTGDFGRFTEMGFNDPAQLPRF
jgi:hypothetical protein